MIRAPTVASADLPDLPAERDPAAGHGEVFTRRWVVDLILDLVDYRAERDLAHSTALEPSCGSGAFVVPMVERLVSSAREHGWPLGDLHGSLLAVDLRAQHVDHCRRAVLDVLTEARVSADKATELVNDWIRCDDFLLNPPPEHSVDYALGNPPYVRLEAVPRERSQAYRSACGTMGGRADVYVGFYEHALRALLDGGVLGFICADRWMRNAYGARLREMISEGWSVESVISMTGVDAFEDEVDAYPAVTVLRRGSQAKEPAVVEAVAGIVPAEAAEIVDFIDDPDTDRAKGRRHDAVRLNGWFTGRSGWPSGSPDRLALISKLETSFPTLEDAGAGTKVGIGVATGADKVFITDDPDAVEPARLLPLALPRDISSGQLQWGGRMLINPWGPDGLVDLREWPRMAAYMTQHRSVLARRHTARNGVWHRTIDRVIDGLVEKPKLYLPDFKETTFPVIDSGKTYPHHNLYWITSDEWDLSVLGGILLSNVANLFMEAYSVKMRGGFLRFQAQYVRRIRVPSPDAIGEDEADALRNAFRLRDVAAATEVALGLYGLGALPN
jgi:hypothetical protein